MKSAGLLVSVGLCFFLSSAWAFLGGRTVGVARAAAGRAWVGGPAAAAASPSLRRRSAWSAPLAARVRAPVASRARLSDEEGDEEGEESEEGEPETPNPLVEESDAVSPFKEGIAFPTSLNGSDVRVGIISARWNADIISGLYKGVNESLIACGVKPSNIFSTYVPGAFELPVTARLLAMSKRVDVIVCLGCLIKGDTMHFEYIASATSSGIMQVSVETLVPVIFGVLTVLDKQQAIVRSTGKGNEGLSWGTSAVEMGLTRMSAFGMGSQGKQQESGAKAGASPLVVFDAAGPKPAAGAGAGAGKNGNGTSEAKPGKKFGF